MSTDSSMASSASSASQWSGLSASSAGSSQPQPEFHSPHGPNYQVSASRSGRPKLSALKTDKTIRQHTHSSTQAPLAQWQINAEALEVSLREQINELQAYLKTKGKSWDYLPWLYSIVLLRNFSSSPGERLNDLPQQKQITKKLYTFFFKGLNESSPVDEVFTGIVSILVEETGADPASVKRYVFYALKHSEEAMKQQGLPSHDPSMSNVLATCATKLERIASKVPVMQTEQIDVSAQISHLQIIVATVLLPATIGNCLSCDDVSDVIQPLVEPISGYFLQPSEEELQEFIEQNNDAFGGGLTPELATSYIIARRVTDLYVQMNGNSKSLKSLLAFIYQTIATEKRIPMEEAQATVFHAFLNSGILRSGEDFDPTLRTNFISSMRSKIQSLNLFDKHELMETLIQLTGVGFIPKRRAPIVRMTQAMAAVDIDLESSPKQSILDAFDQDLQNVTLVLQLDKQWIMGAMRSKLIPSALWREVMGSGSNLDATNKVLASIRNKIEASDTPEKEARDFVHMVRTSDGSRSNLCSNLSKVLQSMS
ncbi:hypothetical protein [Parashewanella tropica]|uniref:hypothetical protein n=1 Tax=Parashewanella tropica TaxID=2547970 RepID=UPI00105A2C33|nr:hypothetical protein [Parashewanella tropica]